MKILNNNNNVSFLPILAGIALRQSPSVGATSCVGKLEVSRPVYAKSGGEDVTVSFSSCQRKYWVGVYQDTGTSETFQEKSNAYWWNYTRAGDYKRDPDHTFDQGVYKGNVTFSMTDFPGTGTYRAYLWPKEGNFVFAESDPIEITGSIIPDDQAEWRQPTHCNAVVEVNDHCFDWSDCQTAMNVTVSDLGGCGGQYNCVGINKVKKNGILMTKFLQGSDDSETLAFSDWDYNWWDTILMKGVEEGKFEAVLYENCHPDKALAKSESFYLTGEKKFCENL